MRTRTSSSRCRAFDVPATGLVDLQTLHGPGHFRPAICSCAATNVIYSERRGTVPPRHPLACFDPKIPDEADTRDLRHPSRRSAHMCRATRRALYSAGRGRARASEGHRPSRFQIRCTTSGKPAHDVTQFGLFFREDYGADVTSGGA